MECCFVIPSPLSPPPQNVSPKVYGSMKYVSRAVKGPRIHFVDLT